MPCVVIFFIKCGLELPLRTKCGLELPHARVKTTTFLVKCGLELPHARVKTTTFWSKCGLELPPFQGLFLSAG